MVWSDKMNWKGGSLTPFTHSFSSFRAVILGHVISILDLDCSHEMMEVSRKWMSVFLISRTCEHIELCYILFHLHFQLHFGTLIHTQTLFVAGLFFISYFFLLPLIFFFWFLLWKNCVREQFVNKVSTLRELLKLLSMIKKTVLGHADWISS